MSADGPAGPDGDPRARRVPAAALRAQVAAIFAAHGLAADDADTAAEALVRADLRGVWSHGVARVSMYCNRLRAGVARARPAMALDPVSPAAALLDGDDGLGLVVARRAMAEAVGIAGRCGVGLVGVRRSGHFGMAALYSEQAAAAGCVGMVFTNASPALPPFGGRSAFFGTSPMAVSVPTGEDAPPFCLDMAMSVVARGKLKFAAQRGEPIPPGLALDAEGRPTTDGSAAFEGVVLPFGGVKGAGLSWMMDLLGGALTGANFGGEVANPFGDVSRPQNAGHLMLAFRADLFLPMAEAVGRVDQVSARVRALPRAAGFDEIQSPGEPEARRAAAYARDGVPLTPDVLDDLARTAEAAGAAWTLDQTVEDRA